MMRLIAAIPFMFILSEAYGSAIGERVVCEGGGATKVVEIVRQDPDQTVPCSVLYQETPTAEKRQLWSASNDAGFCEGKLNAAVEKLKASGYDCQASAVTEQHSASGSLEDEIQAALYREAGARFNITNIRHVDLNDDGLSEYIVNVFSAEHCGASGECPLYILQALPSDRDKLTVIGALQGKEVEVLHGTRLVLGSSGNRANGSPRGYHYIVLYEDVGLYGKASLYYFDGSRYRAQ